MLIYTVAAELFDIALLYSLALLGWYIGERINLPAAPVLGCMLVVGGLRVAGVPLPILPEYVILGLQIALGVMVGGRFDREAINSLTGIWKPALVISVWAVAITVGFGFLISAISDLELSTGILGSSIGGLPEMTILAHDTGADAVTVVIFHIFRLLSTMIVFLFLLKMRRFNDPRENNMPSPSLAKDESGAVKGDVDIEDELQEEEDPASGESGESGEADTLLQKTLGLIKAFAGAALSGGLLMYIGVPAGGLVGALLFIIGASYANLSLTIPPQNTLKWFLCGIGLMVSNQVSMETVNILLSGELLVPLLISVVLTLGSSFVVGYINYRLTGWNYILCFMASAPAGFTVMTGFAMEEGYDPVRVSLLHLCRLVTLKLAIPFLFMIFY